MQHYEEFCKNLGAFSAAQKTGLCGTEELPLCGNSFRSFASGKTPHRIQAVNPSVEFA
jgi:hypothetical protein